MNIYLIAIYYHFHLFYFIYQFIIILNPILNYSLTSATDDLFSARCQSRCLSDLELRHKNNAETRRLLRHQISTLCKEDVQCSSCLIPCRELIFDNNLCDQTFCREAADPKQCRQTCTFIQNATNRSGQCPQLQTRIKIADTECSAFCDADTDCAEIEKCCSFGCSRTCLSPQLNDSRFLPMPEGITVQERKRKRSAILRWVMKRMTLQHTTTYANLFVIQWRWSVRKDSETMTPWQTIMVRNKMYAILKHLLTPGRYYLFRVAAVNAYGTFGYSQPSHPPFKLTKEVKSPPPPNNFTVLPLGENFQSSNEGESAKIGWSPPLSEIPIKDYRLSWWKTSLELAKVFELRQRRSFKGNNDEDDYDGGNELSGIDAESSKKSLVLPSATTKTQINGLEQNQVYIVELFATVDTSEGELRGEPAILFLKTGATSVKRQNKNNSISDKLLPLFDENKHKFRVFVRSSRCLNQLPPQEFFVKNCLATLENLQFQCEYYVRIENYNEDQKMDNNENIIARLTFATLPCEQTPSDIPLQCKQNENYANKINSPSYNNDKLPAIALALNDSPSKVAIVSPEQRIEHLTDLNPKAVYRFRLQAITSLGLGAELAEHFSTGHLASGSTEIQSSNNPSELSFHIGASKIGGLTDEQFSSIVDLPWSSNSLRNSLAINLLRAFNFLIFMFFCL
ncbi:hypothetical protein Mgra_00008218 [Meloidogyne graminicola]|uniref:Anosmin-1 n=1 Tax=Meloidogyne graminicola TaxID=189291 RepID=A0A8S9ZGJ1_9BILA|nr:hypothetical protein Mgra_00008218 [Meloidogyne graminicola]